MPQMMPINWIFMFTFFILIFILFNIMNYYIFYHNYYFEKKNVSNVYFKPYNWKW